MRSIMRSLIKLECYWFTTFLLGVLTSVIYQVIGENRTLDSFLPSLWQYLTRFYLPVALIILLVCLFQCVATPPQLFVYYHIWISHVFPTLKKLKCSPHTILKHIGRGFLQRFFNEYFDTLILNSFREQDVSGRKRHEPVFVRREHLMKKNHWPNWAFAIILLLNTLVLHRCHTDQGELQFRLEVDLRDQLYGIYNNAGKRFLGDTFLDPVFRKRSIGESKRIEKFLRYGLDQDALRIDAAEMPFRWASGGMLPIAHLEGRDWYVLYFRDIEPVGLNISNGGSETENEIKNPAELIYREFSEELVLLSREPVPGDPLPTRQKIFHFSIPLPTYIPPQIVNNEFAERHRQMREEQDGLNIDFVTGPAINPISTPFEVQVKYHNESRNIAINTIESVIFNINPAEFGIEVLVVSRFNMSNNDYLIDGEISEIGSILVRRPVILLSCDYIQEVFRNKNSLGINMKERPYLDCKDLGRIPFGEYIIFDRDIEFRRRRLELLERDARSRNLNEARTHREWLRKYEELFKKIKEQKCDITSKDHSPLTILCPVAWKTIETMCYYNLL